LTDIKKKSTSKCHNKREKTLKTIALMKPNSNPTLHKVRMVAACALIGSVVTGVAFGWADLSFDPRSIGAGLGALAGALRVLHLV
jgi:hypothetical protein